MSRFLEFIPQLIIAFGGLDEQLFNCVHKVSYYFKNEEKHIYDILYWARTHTCDGEGIKRFYVKRHKNANSRMFSLVKVKIASQAKREREHLYIRENICDARASALWSVLLVVARPCCFTFAHIYIFLISYTCTRKRGMQKSHWVYMHSSLLRALYTLALTSVGGGQYTSSFSLFLFFSLAYRPRSYLLMRAKRPFDLYFRGVAWGGFCQRGSYNRQSKVARPSLISLSHVYIVPLCVAPPRHIQENLLYYTL